MNREDFIYSLITIICFILFMIPIIGFILGMYYHNGNIFYPSAIVLIIFSEIYYAKLWRIL